MKNLKEKKKGQENFLSSFIIIAIIIVAISIAFPIILNHCFSSWADSGAFGDSFGVLNAIFSGLAFAGIIVTILIQRRELENQREELKLQRNEMKETRKEYLMNRTTNLIYSQLDRFEKSLNQFYINYGSSTYKSHSAILFLNSNKNVLYKFKNESEEEYIPRVKEALAANLKIYISNKKQIEEFAINAYNSVAVLKRIVYKTDLEVNELNDLKNLFFANIGFITLGIIEQICETSEKEVEIFSTQDYLSYNLKPGQLLDAMLFLKSIRDFYPLRLTNDNFQQSKNDWIKSQGNQS